MSDCPPLNISTSMEPPNVASVRERGYYNSGPGGTTLLGVAGDGGAGTHPNESDEEMKMVVGEGEVDTMSEVEEYGEQQFTFPVEDETDGPATTGEHPSIDTRPPPAAGDEGGRDSRRGGDGAEQMTTQDDADASERRISIPHPPTDIVPIDVQDDVRRERHVSSGEHPIIENPPPHTVMQSAKSGLDFEGNCRLAPLLTSETAAEVNIEESDDDAENPYASVQLEGTSKAPEHCFLDYFGCEDDDPYKLVSVFGALSFALYGSFDQASVIQDQARKKYKIAADSKKTKLPLKKLFKFVTTPGAILEGRQIQLLLVHDTYFKRDNVFARSKEAGTTTKDHLGLSDWRWSDYMSPLPHLKSTPTGHVQQTVDDKDGVLVALRVHGLGVHPDPAYHVLRSATADGNASMVAASDLSRTRMEGSALSWTPLRFNPERYVDGFVKEDEDDHPIIVNQRQQDVPTVAVPNASPPPGGPSTIINHHHVARRREDALAHASFKASVQSIGGTSTRGANDNNPSTRESRRRFALAKEAVQTDQSDEMAFQGVTYPNVEMADTGFTTIVGASLHRVFPRNRFRLLFGLVAHLLSIGCCIAILYIATASYSTCCVSSADSYGMVSGLQTPQCMTVAQDVNITGDGVLVNQCNSDLCSQSGDVASNVPFGFFWGGWLSLGRITVLLLLLSVLSILTGLCAGFFSTRPVALDNAHPRFWRVVYVAQILECALAVVFSVFVLLLLDKETHPVESCDILGHNTHLTNLCTAEYESCSVILVGYFSSHVLGSVASLPYFSYVLIGLSALAFFTSCIPPGPSEEVMETQLSAIPDTAIFRVGPFAPDGITDEQIRILQAEIRSRWRRERFAAAVSKVQTQRKNTADIFTTGSKSSRLDLKGFQTSGKQQSGRTDIFRITQLLKLGHGDGGKSKLRYRHPDPYLSQSGNKLPPSLESNVSAITSAVLSRIRQNQQISSPTATTTNSDGLNPNQLSTTATQHLTGESSSMLTNHQLALTMNPHHHTSQIEEEDSVMMGTASPTSSTLPGRGGGGSRSVTFQEMMRQLDEEKMEESLFDNRLRLRIIEDIMDRVESERHSHMPGVVGGPLILYPVVRSGAIISPSDQQVQQVSPTRYDEITPFFSSPSRNVGREAAIFNQGYLRPPLDPHELECGEMGIHHDVERDVEAEDDAAALEQQAILFERRVPIPIDEDAVHGGRVAAGDEESGVCPINVDDTLAQATTEEPPPIATKARFAGLLQKIKESKLS